MCARRSCRLAYPCVLRKSALAPAERASKRGTYSPHSSRAVRICDLVSSAMNSSRFFYPGWMKRAMKPLRKRTVSDQYTRSLPDYILIGKSSFDSDRIPNMNGSVLIAQVAENAARATGLQCNDQRPRLPVDG